MKRNFNVEAIRKDFPVLNKKIKKQYPVYMDNACVTLKPVQVIEKIAEYYNDHPSCHNRGVHKFSIATGQKFDETRQIVKEFINAREVSEIIFTKNTTEAINIIANSLEFKKNDTIITSDFEHNSNLIPWKVLSNRKHTKHKCIPILDDFSFDLDEYRRTLEKGGVRLVSIIHTSHVTGQTLPAQEITRLAHKHNALVLLDCAQSVSHNHIDVQKLDVDFLAFSFHKIMGPSGTGVLYAKKELAQGMIPCYLGGETVIDADENGFTLSPVPQRFEYGLQNYAGIMGAGQALKYFSSFKIEEIKAHVLELNRFITQALISHDRITLIGPEAPESRGSIINFHIRDIDSGELSLLLDDTRNIMVRSGVHCCHSWYHKKNYTASLRISLYMYNTMEEAELLVKTLLDFINFF